MAIAVNNNKSNNNNNNNNNNNKSWLLQLQFSNSQAFSP
jgi:hypothetical protein